MDKQKKKKLLISVTAGALSVAMIGGIWFGVARGHKDPVYVYEFMNVGMTEYWGDTQDSYGPVSTDNIQTVFLSKTQEITDIKVKEGDQVKKGDLLMSFDTTLSALDLERKRLEVEKLKLQLEDEKKQLQKINAMKPMQQPPAMPDFEPEDPVEPELGPELPAHPGYRISPRLDELNHQEHDGSTPAKAMICWIRNDRFLNTELLLQIYSHSIEMQTQDALDEMAKPELPTEGETHSRASAFLTDMLEEIPFEEIQPELPEAPEVPDLPPEAPPTELPPDLPENPVQPVDPPDTEQQLPVPTDPEPDTEPEQKPEEPTEVPETTEPPVQTEPTLPEIEEPGEHQPGPDLPGINGRPVYCILKVTEGNTKNGAPVIWQGVMIQPSGSYRFFSAAGIPDFTLMPIMEEEPEEPLFPEFDMGSGMTAGQIAQMREEQKKKIKEAEFKIKMAEADYKIKKRELDDGNIHAEFDGVVVSLLSEEEARQRQKPILKVSGGGGFYVEGSVSELDREIMEIGQEVTVTDWNSGETYTGQVVSVGDFPLNQSQGYGGMRNPNASMYPFKAFVDGSANLQAGSYVNIQYSAGGSSHGVYLENPFLRTENGTSYVYVQGKNGRLEKRYVTTGKSLWGNYTEIRSGLTAEDLIAFPYGKNVKPGVKTKLGDMETLYS